MDQAIKGFNERMKKIQAIRMLGTGLDAGEMQEYVHEICFLLLLKVFRREITENPDRTRDDLVFLTMEAMRDLNLKSDRIIAERITNGVLWYRDPSRQEPFRTGIFNEVAGKHEEFKFKYLTEDREHSRWDKGGPTVYMLTEIAQEIIFITREILEEFGFDIEQFYTLQLIKSGNFHKAESSVDNLIARVRTLIRRECDYREDVIRNPQVIFFDKRRNRRKSEEEIKAQFEEEQKVFQDMFSWKKRIKSFPEEQRLEAELVFENLERARMLHNELAKLVVENMALELKVRVEYPESFWRTSNLSFKKDIWQNTVIKYGLDNFDKLEYLLNPLFSADVEFIYPLDWAWEEQTIKGDSIITDLEKWEDEEELSWEEKGVDWEQLTMLYTPVFRTLLEKGEFHYSSLNSLELKERQVWTEQKENIDMLMMLAITGVTLTTAYNMAENVDERLELFRRICERNPDIRELEGKTITSYIDKNDKWIIWDEVNISPYVIRVE
ncbi:MAG: hypothetical protein GX045_05560 [Clostridiaceae bacterium]|nr:hypothetical protein [Clostridiaceae bacterium]